MKTQRECFEVTDHNLPIAVLGPLPSPDSVLERLLAEGRVVPARLDLAALGVPPERPREETISEALAAQREEGWPQGPRRPAAMGTAARAILLLHTEGEET